MNRTARVALAATLLAPLAYVAGAAPAVGAAPPTSVSATSGAPGTVVEVSVADCSSDEGNGVFDYLQVLLISGTAPGEVLAGAGAGDDGTARFVVPDWLDPTEPAVIETSCFAFGPEDEEPTTIPYDPVAFDVLPGLGLPSQTRSFSRTSLLAGQGFEVSGTGCTLPGATSSGVEVFAGADRSGRSFGEPAGFGGGTDLTGGSFSALFVLARGGISFGAGSSDGGDYVLDVEEDPFPIAPGPYTALTYCADDDGLTLFYEPQAIDVTGSAPVDDIDLTVAEGTRRATLAGEGCTAGRVSVELEAESVEDLMGEDDFEELAADPARRTVGLRGGDPDAGVGPFAPRARDRDRLALDPAAPASDGRSVRALADDGFIDAEVDPDGAGSWSITDEAGFDRGFVFGYATCDDPFADGFVYDTQGAVVDATPPEPLPIPTVPATTPATPPAAASPAGAIPGRPTYAG